jgi:uncharacterized DUF497 family protein
MEFEWDEAKRAANLAKHGLDFVDAAQFDWANAQVIPDRRFDYGEERSTAYGLMDGRLMVIIFTMRGSALRMVSFRRANKRETRKYGP